MMLYGLFVDVTTTSRPGVALSRLGDALKQTLNACARKIVFRRMTSQIPDNDTVRRPRKTVIAPRGLKHIMTEFWQMHRFHAVTEIMA